MILEQEFVYLKKPLEFIDSLNQEGEEPVEIEKDIFMLCAEKNNNELITQIKDMLINNDNPNKISCQEEQNEENEENNNNKNIFLVKYKNLYIGGLSNNFRLREGFGLNKYENSSAFYLGQWKNNMKEGTGFLKIDDNKLYIGSFHNNQLEGFGIIYYKIDDTFYFGEFNNGEFSKGVYYNLNKELYYRGKFEKNKKNDQFCTFLEKNNRQLFIGDVKDDVFMKGYLCLYQINEIVRQNEDGEDAVVADFNIDKFFYFDKADEKKINFIPSFEFENEFRNKIQENMKKIFEVDYITGLKIKEIISYFNYLESLADDEDHNYLERYNEDNEQSLEKFFMSNFNFYFSQFQEIQEQIDINEIRKEIEIPEINKENANVNE
jgi:hypothetical protein